MTNHEVWDKTIELNGVSIQSVVCMEECSELIKAISKRLRGELDIENNLADKVADVTISLYQLTRMYDIDDADVHAWIDRKTERQRKRNALQDHQSGETTRDERAIRRMDHRAFRRRHHGHADEDRETIRQTATPDSPTKPNGNANTAGKGRKTMRDSDADIAINTLNKLHPGTQGRTRRKLSRQ